MGMLIVTAGVRKNSHAAWLRTQQNFGCVDFSGFMATVHLDHFLHPDGWPKMFEVLAWFLLWFSFKRHIKRRCCFSRSSVRSSIMSVSGSEVICAHWCLAWWLFFDCCCSFCAISINSRHLTVPVWLCHDGKHLNTKAWRWIDWSSLPFWNLRMDVISSITGLPWIIKCHSPVQCFQFLNEKLLEVSISCTHHCHSQSIQPGAGLTSVQPCHWASLIERGLKSGETLKSYYTDRNTL